MAVPMTGPAMWGGVDHDTTGSIGKSPGRLAVLTPQNLKLSKMLDAEDTRRAMAALGTAVDPQGSGQSVNWDNPASGARGAFRPTGSPYPLEGRICRSFIADIEAGGDTERVEGAACRDKTAEWSLTRVKTDAKTAGSMKKENPARGKKA
jgi:surface antigen